MGDGLSLQVTYHGLDEAIDGSSGSVAESESDAVETWVKESSKAFRSNLVPRVPVRSGRGSQWERAKSKAPGYMRKTVRRQVRLAGIDSTGRVRIGNTISRILVSGAPAHEIRPRNGMLLWVNGERLVYGVVHPGVPAMPFFEQAVSSVDGTVTELSRRAGFATADKMAERLARRGRRK